jgi:hypothetical protein
VSTFYFTYGSNHVDEAGNSLGRCYTPVTVTGDDMRAAAREFAFSPGSPDENIGDCCEPMNIARTKMFAARDDKWSMQYDSAEAAGVERFGLVERSLESVAFDRLRMKRKLIAQTLNEERDKLRAALEMTDKCAVLMESLPESIVPSCVVHHDTCELLIFHLSREQVKEVLSCLHAGKWTKKICPGSKTRIDYDAEINGVKIQLYGTPPPESCRIIEREEEVPAHTRIVRELVCA